MRKRPARSVSIVVLLVSLLGVAALFLPLTTASFVFSKFPSAWDVVKVFSGEFILIMAPLFLVVPIVAWEVRRLVADQLKTGEVAAAYGISTAAMLPVLGVLTAIVNENDAFSQVLIFVLAFCVALVGANLLLLIRNRRAGLSREATAEAFLLGGYLPNAILSLAIGLLVGGLSELYVGAYLIAVVCIGYVAAIVLLSREKPAGHQPPSDRP